MNNAYLRFVTVCASLMLVAFCPLRLQALDFNLVDGQPIHTQSDLDSLKTGDTLVLICPNCHSGKMVVYNADKDSPAHVNWMKPGTTFTCPDCGAKLTAVEKDGRIVYECSKCKALGYVTAFKTASR